MAEPGWYDDPRDVRSIRWWDGARWTEHSAPRPAQAPPAPMPRIRKLSASASESAASADIYALAPASGSSTGGTLSKRTMLLLVAGAVLVLILGVNALASASTALLGGAALTAAGSSPTATPTRTATPKPTPTGPEISYVTAEETESIPFARVTQDDPNRDVGVNEVTVPGVDGTRSRTFRVTLEDGIEVSRKQIGERVTAAPVNEVTAVGTRVPPPPPAPEPEAFVEAEPAPQGGGCDSNYADACVPIASDVDCAGGSGNGPAYFDGVARVVGSDIYDLDRDKDGYACED